MGKGTSLASVCDLLERGELAHLKTVAAWLGRPVVGVVIDEIRRQHGRYAIKGVHKINRTKSLGAHHLAFPDESPGPLDLLIRQESEQRFTDWIDTLPPTGREILLLKMEGLSYKDIAKKLDCTVWNIDYHMRRAKRRFEESYGR